MNKLIDELNFNNLLIETKRSELQKLSDDRTRLIKRLLEEGLSVIQVSKITNLSRQRVYKLINEDKENG
jgi:transposase|tara:strand:- start:5220 stop:5426 length:207 start_codon:yes stop_codon:yes gene_type:complete